ncbi:MAG: DUF1273 domain-containing protein [Oscillospiraceae bacterium]|nr:DUF1273 domain-containing protein [Oscillospiraceae bacterium]
MKSQTCCFTGHRSIPASEIESVKRKLETNIILLLEQGVTDFICGGAVGFDTLAALSVLKMKENNPGIRLILFLPCKDQTKFWKESDKKIYGAIREKADRTVYLSETYAHGCMQKRNKAMVENSRVCLCYCKRPNSGTGFTVRYAEKVGLRIVNIS